METRMTNSTFSQEAADKFGVQPTQNHKQSPSTGTFSIRRNSYLKEFGSKLLLSATQRNVLIELIKTGVLTASKG
jgi:hypothetical protein